MISADVAVDADNATANVIHNSPRLSISSPLVEDSSILAPSPQFSRAVILRIPSWCLPSRADGRETLKAMRRQWRLGPNDPASAPRRAARARGGGGEVAAAMTRAQKREPASAGFFVAAPTSWSITGEGCQPSTRRRDQANGARMAADGASANMRAAACSSSAPCLSPTALPPTSCRSNRTHHHLPSAFAFFR
jgi:hypothetical protein